jgi:branched-chain amino acid transport system permease protein
MPSEAQTSVLEASNAQSELRWRVLGVAALVAATGSLPFWPAVDSYIVAVAVRALIFIALGQAWNIIAGVGGQLSLGHGVFFGLGAYATAMLFNDAGIPPWLGTWVGVAVAAVVALAMGGATFRLRGVYFALATVAISLGFEKLARHFVELTGGDSGLAVTFLGDSLWGMQARSPNAFLWLSLTVVLLYYLLTRWILGHRFGFELQAVRDDEEAAAAAGVNVFRTKLAGLLLSAGMTALVGTLHVQFYLSIDPGTAFGLFQAIQIQLPSLIGGLGTAGGPVIGGAIMVLVTEITNWASTKLGLQGVDVLAYGLMLLLIVMRAPQGILGRIALGRAAGRRR